MPSDRAGKFVTQPEGYKVFIPKPLPPDPIRLDMKLVSLISEASGRLGQLDGLAVNLPNPNIFVSMFVRKEALLSSQIEGTRTTLDEVLSFEAQGKKRKPNDVTEVLNYVNAMDYGLERLEDLPLSLRLIREIHRRLLIGTRGDQKSPGEFRNDLNWLGVPGCSINEADFIPPPPLEMGKALHDLENFLHDHPQMPIPLLCALVHAQFETIHPFMDGNGRIGRLLITFLLCHYRALSRPLLYLSYFFNKHKHEYCDRLNRIRFEGDWEGWISFFMNGIIEISEKAIRAAHQILELRKTHLEMIKTEKPKSSINLTRLFDLLFESPYMPAGYVIDKLKVSKQTGYNLLNALEKLQILNKIRTEWGMFYVYREYLDILREGTKSDKSETQDDSSTQKSLPFDNKQ